MGKFTCVLRFENRVDHSSAQSQLSPSPTWIYSAGTSRCCPCSPLLSRGEGPVAVVKRWILPRHSFPPTTLHSSTLYSISYTSQVAAANSEGITKVHSHMSRQRMSGCWRGNPPSTRVSTIYLKLNGPSIPVPISVQDAVLSHLILSLEGIIAHHASRTGQTCKKQRSLHRRRRWYSQPYNLAGWNLPYTG